MNCYLLIDFGSTYTKLTLIDLEKERLIATSSSLTTIDDLIIGYEKAFSKLLDRIDKKNITISKKMACSSAAGGLKMIAIGLVDVLTSHAAKEAALGAGARVLKTYSQKLSRQEIDEIIELNADIILLAGGTDGGNEECVIHNSKLLSKSDINIPIVYAGNKSCADEIKEILSNKNCIITKNVMPVLNKINVEPVREVIRDIFMKNIIVAKGIDKAEKLVGDIIMPTPYAVMKASQLLADGSDKHSGIGELIVVDIGGATTDVHSVAKGEPTSVEVSYRGLEEPYCKRSVEGDLGMRYSAISLLETATTKFVEKYLLNKNIDLVAACQYRNENVEYIAKTKEDLEVDIALAKTATAIAVSRHAGFLQPIFTPLGQYLDQHGKDLKNCKQMIATGGILINSPSYIEILKAGCFDKENRFSLKPVNPRFLLDKQYILAAMGLLSIEYPDIALKIMKENLEGY